ncbi:hypothetical protein [Candidatus Ichthyocystis hellenicum]|uniref:hypothetical protein n=1 Tax=Candidatus Ichthyocystis hellenicum TaxID=1561003 RepID=UPI000B873ABE|nr:hypothetical protein [Candidatus Ichthyocystis hellenicum]
MNKSGGSTGITVTRGCCCTVCTNETVRSVLSDLNSLSREATKVFTLNGDTLGQDTYTFLVKPPEDKSLVSSDSKCSLSVKFIIALAILLAVTIVACVVFLVLAHKGVIHTGISSEMMSSITKWTVLGLCVASFSYLMFGASYLAGRKFSNDDNVCKAIHFLDRSTLRKLAVAQKEEWERIDETHKCFQDRIVDFVKSKVKLSNKDVDVLSKMEEDVAHAKSRYDELDSSHRSVVAECNSIRTKNEEMELMCSCIAEKNLLTSKDNDILRGRLDALKGSGK